MEELILKLSDIEEINFTTIINEVIKIDCREEASKIVSHYINGDFLMRFKLLEVYSKYLTSDYDAFILDVDNLKIKLIKEKKLNKNQIISSEKFLSLINKLKGNKFKVKEIYNINYLFLHPNFIDYESICCQSITIASEPFFTNCPSRIGAFYTCQII